MENAGGEMGECSNPGSPNQSSSTSPHREVKHYTECHVVITEWAAKSKYFV